jgi:hypothetical protein
MVDIKENHSYLVDTLNHCSKILMLKKNPTIYSLKNTHDQLGQCIVPILLPVRHHFLAN